VKAQTVTLTLLVLALGPARADAQQPMAPAQQPAAPMEHANVPAQPSPSSAEHIQTAQKFLMAWGHQRWDDLRHVATDEVTIRIGDKSYVLAPGMGKSEVMLVFPFRGLSTVRVDGAVKGITIEDVGLKVGSDEVRGPGTLTLTEEAGAFRVMAVSTGHSANP
jgi:hypothetical protein